MEVFITACLVIFIVLISMIPTPAPTTVVPRKSSFLTAMREQFEQTGWVDANCSY